jgi:hypothetical protein
MQKFPRSVMAASLLLSLTTLSLTACGGGPSTQTNPAVSPDSAASPLGLSSASPSPSPSVSPSAKPSPSAPVPNAAPEPAIPEPPKTTPEPSKTTPTQTLAANSSTQEVTLYEVDNQCEEFVAKQITIPTQDANNTLVGKVLANSNSPDFKIDNYRIQVKDGEATIDLRLPPEAKRPFAAMSACEQRSLLGSLSKTLTSNPKLKIDSVRFTDGKEELVF